MVNYQALLILMSNMAAILLIPGLGPGGVEIKGSLTEKGIGITS